MKQVLPVLFALFTLLACAPPAPAITPSPAATMVVPTLPPVPSQTPSPIRTPTATPWIKIYPTKQALVIYGESARVFFSSRFITVGPFDFNPQLVLYADGQLILHAGRYEKQLSQGEIQEVLQKMEQLGFFELQEAYEANWQSLFSTSPPEDIQDLTLTSVEVTVNNGTENKTIKYMKEDEKYLVPAMKEMISYLDHFSLEGTRPYRPDRFLVGIVGENEIPLEEDQTAIPWPEEIPPPSYLPDSDLIYLEGTEALRFYELFNKNDDTIFSFEGEKFQALPRPLYPHECHIYHYFEVQLPRLSDPPFTCDDW